MAADMYMNIAMLRGRDKGHKLYERRGIAKRLQALYVHGGLSGYLYGGDDRP